MFCSNLQSRPTSKWMSRHNKNKLLIREVSWQEAQAQLSHIRQEVFILEQHVPVELEWDEHDEYAIHLLALGEKNEAIGCARILPKGLIGRMAVLKPWRRQGVGRSLLDYAIAVCETQGWNIMSLSAQIQAIPFYEKAGFKVCGEQYMDAGIPHRDMQLKKS